MAHITVIGTGYVGLTTGVCFAHIGHSVTCVDIDEAKVARLRAGDIPIYEPGLSEIVVESSQAGRLHFTSSYEEGLRDAEFVFIAVGTPTAPDGHSADLRYVFGAARRIAQTLTGPAVIVNKSTSPVGTCERLAAVLRETRPEFGSWSVVSNPEFLREGSAVHDCLHPARIVLGSADPAAAQAVADLYVDLNAPTLVTDTNTAEMIKYASNAFLATRISFVNEVARICDALGADITVVADGMGLDPRIGPAFLNAGLGYGGSCFPKDVAALTHMAAEAGLHPQLLRTVTDINADQRRWPVERLREQLGTLQGVTVGILGLAFKPNTDDLREAPALDIITALHEEGASVRACDPVACDLVAAKNLPVTLCDTPLETVRGTDAVLLATEWDEYRDLPWERIAHVMRGDLVLDGRNALDPSAVSAAGLQYIGVGRPRVAAEVALEALSA